VHRRQAVRLVGIGSAQPTLRLLDLQLGGKDVWALNSSVNQSLGKQRQLAINGFQEGMVIDRVVLK
jgi:hypothetical protein